MTVGSESPLIGGVSLSDTPSRTLFTPQTARVPKTSYAGFETPTRQPRTPFVFLSDRKSVPTELKNLQERTIKRRRDFVARMHELVRTGTMHLTTHDEM